MLGRRGRDLALDASGVRHLGACGLELLVAARNTWERDGHRLTLMAPSPQMRADLETLGVTPGIFATDVSGTAGSDPVEPAP